MPNINSLKNHSIYLAPKNDATILLQKLLLENNFKALGFIDNFKNEDDVYKKNVFNDNDIIILYSPTYYKEIIKTINTKEIYLLSEPVNNLNFSVTFIESFSGYKKKVLPKKNFNSYEVQKEFWESHLKKSYENDTNLKKYGYTWGDPNNPNDTLGNYLSIKEILISYIREDNTVLELGTLGGKWTPYLTAAKRIICVDINSFFIETIKNNFRDVIKKFEFYISKGNELEGIESKSIDFIFCIDTLVRVEKKFIIDYIKEISRVLKDNGKAIIHLPNSDIESCIERDFTKISTKEIEDEVKKYFNNYSLDSKTITHGTLLKINL